MVEWFDFEDETVGHGYPHIFGVDTGATHGSDIDERLGALNRMAQATGRTFLTATTDDAPALEACSPTHCWTPLITLTSTMMA